MEVTVESVGSNTHPAPTVRLFGAVLERGYAREIAPGATCVLRIRRLGQGAAAVEMAGAGLLALAP